MRDFEKETKRMYSPSGHEDQDRATCHDLHQPSDGVSSEHSQQCYPQSLDHVQHGMSNASGRQLPY